MTLSLKGRIVLITGASAGIGKACAKAFAAEGARLLLAARRVELLQQAAPALEAAGAAAVRTLSLDVRDAGQVERTIEQLPEEWRAIDVLVNTAGLSRGLDKLYEGHRADWEEMIDTTVKGLLYVTRAGVTGMVERGRGHGVNLAATDGGMNDPTGAV